jgi:hypothetical protein
VRWGPPSTRAVGQAPRVPTWFFFESNNNFLKFISDDNNKRVFDSVVVVAFRIAFRAEIHANDVFLFFKNHF